MATKYETTLNEVRQWSLIERAAFVRALLESLVESPSQPTLPQARGLLSTDRPPPSDADIESILDTRRRERFEHG